MLILSMKQICVIDGQGGSIGRTIVKKLKAQFEETVEVIALGTNTIATANMIKAKANRGASGENAIIQTVEKGRFIALIIILPHPLPWRFYQTGS